MKKSTYDLQVKKALAFYEKAGIILSEEEKNNVEVADFGLDRVEELGLQLVVYINTERVCAKEMVLEPFQTCPEHKHVPTNGNQAKEETFRCRYGRVFLYVEGEGDAKNIRAKMPATDVSVFHEIVLEPGDQYTIMPETWHWFQADSEGAVISEFSTRSTDETDQFTDKRLVREPRIED